jgi:hypothetical protein
VWTLDASFGPSRDSRSVIIALDDAAVRVRGRAATRVTISDADVAIVRCFVTGEFGQDNSKSSVVGTRTVAAACVDSVSGQGLPAGLELYAGWAPVLS